MSSDPAFVVLRVGPTIDPRRVGLRPLRPRVASRTVAPMGTSIRAAAKLSLKRLASLWIAVVFLLIPIGDAPAQSGTAAHDPKQVLFFFSYGPNFEPWVTWTTEIRRELTRTSPWPLEFQEHSIVTALRGDDPADRQFVEYLTALYARMRPDLIIAMGAPAARFVQKHRQDLFPTTPMLLAAVEARWVHPSMLSGQDHAATTVVDHAAIMENILRLLPDTTSIAMIIGNSPAERIWIENVQKELEPVLAGKVRLLFYNERPFGETLEQLAHLPPRTAIYFQQMMVDGEGAVYGDKEPLRRIAGVANAPVFVLDQTYFRGGVVGGPMLSPSEAAQPTAALAVRMLAGEELEGSADPPIGFASPTYDWRQLRRWNIGEGRLPPEAVVMFREPTAWERYSWQIASIAAAILLQAALITVLLGERRARQRAEVQARKRVVELAHVNRFSTAGELSAVIAHEISQPLGAISSNAEAGRIMLKSPEPDVAGLDEILDEILRDDWRAVEVIKRMRALLKKAPFELQDLDLNDLARETVAFLSTIARGREVRLVSEIAPDSLPIRGDPIQLQQVILNLVVNGMDAMKDTPDEDRIVVIGTSRVDGFAELSVDDRGTGISNERPGEVFEPFYTTKAEGMGMGLSIARTIVEAHEGRISAQNRERGGASFRVRLPLARSIAGRFVSPIM